jgi:hypothetical protein
MLLLVLEVLLGTLLLVMVLQVGPERLHLLGPELGWGCREQLEEVLLGPR